MKIVDKSILFFSKVYLSKFSLFLSQNFLWKLSTFRGYKDIYSRVYEECERSIFIKQGILATRPRDWNEARV